MQQEPSIFFYVVFGSLFVIIMESPDLERSNLIGISEKQGTRSRT